MGVGVSTLAMSSLSGALSFAMDYLVVAASPGPNFLLVSRIGMSGPRVAVTQTAIGVVVGATLLAALSAAFAHSLAWSGPALVLAQVVLTGVILRWAWSSFRRAWTNEARPRSVLGGAHFRIGLLTAVSNPFTAAFLATATVGTLDWLTTTAVVVAVASTWYSLLGWAFCRSSVQAFYAQRARLIEAVFAVLLFIMGLRALAKLVAG